MVYDSVSALTQQQLRVFVAVAREGTFVGAGRALLLTEPAVSNHIRSLEKLLSTKLIVRSPGRRGVQLTEAGRELAEVCDTTLRTLEQGIQGIRARHGPKPTTITIGAPPELSGFILPRLIASFRTTHPEVGIHIEAYRNAQILESLRQGRIQLGIVVTPYDDTGVVGEPFPDAVVNIIGPIGHRLAGDRRAGIKELEHESIIAADDLSAPRLALNRLATSAGIRLNVVMVAQDVHARIQAVINGFGIAPVPMSALSSHYAARGADSAQIVVLNVEGFPIRMERQIVYRPDALPEAVREFKEHLQKHRAEIEAVDTV